MGFVSLFAQPGDHLIAEPKEPEFASELDFLDWLWKQPSKPDRLRFQAAAEVAKYRHATLKAITKVSEDDFSSLVEAARLRSAAVSNVIAMKVVPKALPPKQQHSPEELRPSPNGADGTFKRRF
jgi:hypothetical protein